VMETRKTVQGQEHPSTLTSMNNLAATYSNQGRWKEAEELELKQLEISRRVLGEEYPNTLTSMGNLAVVFKEQDRDEEAMALLEDCTRMQKRVLGPDHPYTTSLQHALNKWRMGESQDLNRLPGGNCD